MKNKKIIIPAVAFVKHYLIGPQMKSNDTIRYYMTEVLIGGVKPLNKRFPTGFKLFGEVDYILKKHILNPEDMIEPIVKGERVYGFKNGILWQEPPP